MDFTQLSEDALYQSIGRLLLRSLPSEWQNVTLLFEMIDEDVSEISAKVASGAVDASGSPEEMYISLRPSGFELDEAFFELARRMDEAGHGKWQSATFTMNRQGKFNIDFVYPE